MSWTISSGCSKSAASALSHAAVLAQPRTDVVLSGATTTDQLRRNLAALDVDYAEELDHRLTVLSEKRAEYWSTRAGLAWD